MSLGEGLEGLCAQRSVPGGPWRGGAGEQRRTSAAQPAHHGQLL